MTVTAPASAADFLNRHRFEVYADRVLPVLPSEAGTAIVGGAADTGSGGGSLASLNKMVQNKLALNKNKNKNKARHDGGQAASGLMPSL